MKSCDVTAANDWCEKHGKLAVFFERMVPGVRSRISIPAGMNNMPLPPFLVLTALGSSVWATVLTLAGYYLGQNYEVIQSILAPYSKGIGIAVVIIIIGWFIKNRLSNRKNNKNKSI